MGRDGWMSAETIGERELADAWVYLLSRVLVDRQEKVDLAEEGVDYNVIKYNPLGSAEFVNPNLDVAYLEAWIAVDEQTSVVLHVPRIEGLYYTAQILDEWGEVITNINERLYPETPFGDFVLHAPGASIPDGIGTPIELHAKKAKLLGRVEIAGDPDRATRLQQEFTLRPLGTPQIEAPSDLPPFSDESLPGVDVFRVAAKLLEVPDPAGLPEMQDLVRRVARSVRSSPGAAAEMDRLLNTSIIPQFERDAVSKPGVFENGWMGIVTCGHYGDDWLVRTCANRVGLWANEVDEVIYYVGSFDGAGAPLDGGLSCSLHFPADSLPEDQCDAYWSITLLSVPDYRVMPNALQRYNLNSYSPLVKEPDGSLRIDIGPVPQEGRPEANWLPTRAGAVFSLTLRNYRPTAGSRHPIWMPPPVVAQL
jgi:hypothetical protein